MLFFSFILSFTHCFEELHFSSSVLFCSLEFPVLLNRVSCELAKLIPFRNSGSVVEYLAVWFEIERLLVEKLLTGT